MHAYRYSSENQQINLSPTHGSPGAFGDSGTRIRVLSVVLKSVACVITQDTCFSCPPEILIPNNIVGSFYECNQRLGGGGGVTILSPFWEGTARK